MAGSLDKLPPRKCAIALFPVDSRAISERKPGVLMQHISHVGWGTLRFWADDANVNDCDGITRVPWELTCATQGVRHSCDQDVADF